MIETKDLLSQLRELKPTILADYKAKDIGLFGSFVCGEQSEDSDIDVLVEFEEGADLFDLVGLGQYLEEILQRKVDVVPKRAIRPELRESIVGVPGKNLLRFAGTIPLEDLEIMRQALKWIVNGLIWMVRRGSERDGRDHHYRQAHTNRQ